MEGYLTAGVWTAILIALLILTILWVLIPFAVFGIKKRLDAMLVEQKKATANLERMNIRPASGRESGH
jgi:hypothetical protein